jgi:hypothetical protein
MNLSLFNKYDIKPLSLLSFYAMMFEPRKIKELDLKTSRWEQEHAKDMFNSKISQPNFNIKLQDLMEKGSYQKIVKRDIWKTHFE